MCATLCNNVGLSFLGDFQIPQEDRRSWGSPRKSWGFPKKKVGICPKKKLGISKMIVLPFGVWLIGVAPRRVQKIN